MGRSSTQYVCQACGYVALRWSGKCEGCGQWNSLVEERSRAQPTALGGVISGRSTLIETLERMKDAPELTRLHSSFGEFDRVCGGGIVPGSLTLLGGDPGVGKSTLLLQVAAYVASLTSVLYISGEEGIDQVRMRAERLGVSGSTLGLISSTSVGDVSETLKNNPHISLVIVDSIQTLSVAGLDAAPGTVSQIRASAHALSSIAKSKGMAMMFIGHVTKEGFLAGPRILEHMVDTVLYFEGERSHPFRILRAVKNRFGPTDEIGVFDMTQTGVQEVTNPSALFLSDRHQDITGACVFVGIEGTRPVLVEMQALAASSTLASPRRASVGWENQRLAMVLAILDARCKMHLTQKDVYFNVVGGLRITEPAGDLAAAAALLSCALDIPLSHKVVAFGELSLSGEVRPVTQQDARLKEAKKLGFQQALVPKTSKKHADHGLELTPIAHIRDLVDYLQRLKATTA
jgi:DNA repair protein RadA/Sms